MVIKTSDLTYFLYYGNYPRLGAFSANIQWTFNSGFHHPVFMLISHQERVMETANKKIHSQKIVMLALGGEKDFIQMIEIKEHLLYSKH